MHLAESSIDVVMFVGLHDRANEIDLRKITLIGIARLGADTAIDRRQRGRARPRRLRRS